MSHHYDDSSDPVHNCWSVVFEAPKSVIEKLVRVHTATVVMDWAREAHLKIAKEEQDRVAAADKAKRDVLLKRIEDGEIARRELQRMDGKDV